jgi:phage terminase large subunit-like protein
MVSNRSRPKSSTSQTPALRDSHGALFVKFCAEFVVHGEGDLYGQPFILRPDQQLWAFRWYELDEFGSWWHERCYYEAPKGDGKTMLLAACALFELFGPVAPDHPNVPVAAAGQDQAMKDGIYGRITQILEHPNCKLRRFAKVGYDLIERTDRPGQIRSVASNGNTSDGGLPTLYIADEVQDWFHSAADAHERNENSTVKRESPVGRSISASTPGEYAGDGSVGWRLHNYGIQVDSGVVDDPHFLFFQHAADEKWRGKDDDGKYLLDDPEILEVALREANVGASDRKIGRLLRRYWEIPRHRFCRFHLGWWVQSDGERWMDMDAYGQRVREGVERLVEDGEQVVAFFDGSTNDDATGIVAMTADGRTDVIGCWAKPEYGEGWRVPRDEVNAAVEDMFANYDVAIFACDPAQWRQELIDWVDRYGDSKVIEFPPSNARMAPACEQFLADVINGELSFCDNEQLWDHVRNAVSKRTMAGVTIRKEGPESPRKIDLAVCAVGANDMRLRYLTAAFKSKKKPNRNKARSF